MTPLITRLVRTVVPVHGPEIGRCLVCRASVRDDGGAMRLPGGGYVHQECATYRMRHRARRTLRTASPNGHHEFTGE